MVTEFAVGITREDLAAVAAEELDGGSRFEGEGVAVDRRSAHVSYEERKKKMILAWFCLFKPISGTSSALFIHFCFPLEG